MGRGEGWAEEREGKRAVTIKYTFGGVEYLKKHGEQILKMDVNRGKWLGWMGKTRGGENHRPTGILVKEKRKAGTEENGLGEGQGAMGGVFGTECAKEGR